MTAIRRAPAWALFLLFCALGALGGFGCVYMVGRQAPITLVNVHEADGVALRNGALDVRLTLVRTRTCDAHVDRWLWHTDGERDDAGELVRRWVPLPATTNPPTPLGVEVSYILSLPLPANVTPGEWFYWSRTYDGCPLLPLLASPARESPNVPVLVTEADTPPPGPKVPEVLLPLSVRPDASK